MPDPYFFDNYPGWMLPHPTDYVDYNDDPAPSSGNGPVTDVDVDVDEPTDEEPEPTGEETPPHTPTADPVGNLEVPGNDSYMSGIGYVSGWVCEGERVEIEIDGGLYLPPVARGMSRGDTEETCGDRDNGFLLLWNWNLLGEGQHTARLIVDGKTIQTNRFTVTTLGEEFLRGVSAECRVEDFPSPDEDVLLRWQEGIQGFALVPEE